MQSGYGSALNGADLEIGVPRARDRFADGPVLARFPEEPVDENRMADFSIPLAGLSRASADFNQAAGRIARSSVPIASAAGPADNVDLSQEAVALLQAKNDFEANAKSVRVFDDMARSTLDMIR